MPKLPAIKLQFQRLPMNNPKLINFLFLALFLQSAAWATGAFPCAAALAKLDRLVQSNAFEVRRDIYQYAELFPQSFLDRLSSLKGEGHWLDAGSGEGFAVEDLMNRTVLDFPSLISQMEPSFRKPRKVEADPKALEVAANALNGRDVDEKPRITAIALKMERKPPQRERLEFKTGRYFEDIPTDEMAPVDLITDLYGVMSYSPKIDEALRKYHSLLKTKGKAYIFLGDYLEATPTTGILRFIQGGGGGWDAPFARSEVKLKDGTKVSLLDWVRSLKGFSSKLEHRKIEASSFSLGLPGAVLRTTLVLEKTEDNAEIPNLRLLHSTEGKPPVRIFEVVD